MEPKTSLLYIIYNNWDSVQISILINFVIFKETKEK